MEERGEEIGTQSLGGFFIRSSADGQPRLIGSRCTNCGKNFFPKRLICPYCFSDEKIVEALLGPRGRIYAFTTVRVPPPLGFEVPYSYGYVDLIEDDVRVPAMFTKDRSWQLRIGMEVILVIDKLQTDREGNEILGYKFKPIEE